MHGSEQLERHDAVGAGLDVVALVAAVVVDLQLEPPGRVVVRDVQAVEAVAVLGQERRRRVAAEHVVARAAPEGVGGGGIRLRDPAHLRVHLVRAAAPVGDVEGGDGGGHAPTVRAGLSAGARAT